ncbi:MAG: amino acid racemase [Synergistales bacterium]|nr:amino acid racemase [Synergistales bacterium]
MKTIGLIGGLTWESTVEYYRIINREVLARLGGTHSGDILLYSFDFDHIDRWMADDRFDAICAEVVDVGRRLETAGAGLLVICSNTIHRCFPRLEETASVPLIHIADAAAAQLKAQGARHAALLGTRFTMEGEFYRTRLRERHGITTVIPREEDRREIDRIINEELTFGRLEEASRKRLVGIIEELAGGGAEAAVLGCTELPLLVQQRDTSVPIVDTMTAQAMAAVDMALAGEA